MIDYLKETLTEEQLFKLVYEKGQSLDSVQVLRSALSNFEYFTKEQFDKPRLVVLQDLMKEYKENRDTRAPIVLMNQFKDWMAEDHFDIKTGVNGRPLKAKRGKSQKDYLSQIKKWMRLCGAIRIDIDDYRDFVSIPNSQMEEEDEANPVTTAELKEIILNTRNGVRRAKWYFMKCTAARHLEALRIKKKYIDFSQNPSIVKLPKHIVKGKTRTRYAYLDSETRPLVAEICNRLDDNDYVFRPNDTTDVIFRNNENRWWSKLMTKLNMDEKGNNGHLIKRIHSIRSFAMKAVEKGNTAEMGDAYGGHKKYVGKYMDKTEEERREIFNRSERYMMIFKEIEVLDNEEVKEQHAKDLVELKQQFDQRFEDFKKEMYEGAYLRDKHPEKIKFRDLRNVEN